MENRTPAGRTQMHGYQNAVRTEKKERDGNYALHVGVYWHRMQYALRAGVRSPNLHRLGYRLYWPAYVFPIVLNQYLLKLSIPSPCLFLDVS